MATLTKKKDDYDEQLKKEFDSAAQLNRVKIQHLEEEQDKVQKRYENLQTELEENYHKKQKWYEEQELNAAIARSEANEQEIAKAAQYRSESLRKLEEDYKEQQETLRFAFEKYSNDLKEKKDQLDKEIQDYENKQNAIIEQFKKDEETKQKQDFYRIKLSDNDIEDVTKLRKVADTLNNPTILYKLIWENYYKTKFSELVGRVAPNKKCGIYKITNLINGKVYIGQTKQSFNDRWRTHIRRGLKAEPGTNNKLYTAMWEEGVENFSFEVLLECKPEELNEKERYFIQFFKAQEWGYNSTGGNK